jgi:hypothetical protein
VVLPAEEGTFLCVGGAIVPRVETVPDTEGRGAGRVELVVVVVGLLVVLPANDWRGFAGLVIGLREVVVDTEGREEVEDDSVLRRSLVVPEGGALVVVDRLVVPVAIRFERPF